MIDENNNIENLKLEIENLRKARDEYLNGWKRAKADYLNLKKEMEAQNTEIKEWMSKIMLLPILEIMDSFDKALNAASLDLKTSPWFAGIEGTKKQLVEYLKTRGVEAMKVKGEKFNPVIHEAIESVEGSRSADESELVTEELQKGYTINGEVLRPAKVKIYK